MSTYYFLFCKKCRETVVFTGRWFPVRWGWMADAYKLVPEFVGKHSDHLEEVEIVSEHDERIYEDDIKEFGWDEDEESQLE